VGAGARVLTLDTCGGLVSAAVAERLGGWGCCAAAHLGGCPPKQEALAQLNLSATERRCVRQVSVEELLQRRAVALLRQQQDAQPGAGAEGQLLGGAGMPPADAPQPPQQEQPAGEDGAPSAASEAAPSVAEAPEAPVAAEAPEAAELAKGRGPLEAAVADAEPVPAADALQQRQQGQQRAPKELFDAPFDSCIVAAPGVDPGPALRLLLPLLAPSASFALYCPFLQPLAEAHEALRAKGLAVNLSLQESWWREYQASWRPLQRPLPAAAAASAGASAPTRRACAGRVPASCCACRA
jgi:tRNA (adenine-N(1)-)-methyltransferase non-catalytic subunit